MIDIRNLAYSCLIAGDAIREYITENDAKITLENWIAEGNEEYASVDASEFAKEWNAIVTRMKYSERERFYQKAIEGK